MTPGRVAAAVAGLALLAFGVVAAPDSIAIGPILLTSGGLLLLFALALPMVSQIELGAPLLVRVTVAAKERRERLHQFIEDCRGLLVVCATDLCLDPDSAARTVDATVSRVVATWRGADADVLRTYLLCVLVREAEYETRTRGSVATAPVPFLRLSLQEREVLVLGDRAGLDDARVAGILGLSAADVPALRAHALAGLDPAAQP